MADQQDPPVPSPDGSSGEDPAPPPIDQPPPAKKPPAKRTPAKSAAAKKAPTKAAKKAPVKKVSLPESNGAAKETAAQAKSTVATSAPVLVPAPGPQLPKLPIGVAIAAGILAILVVLLARRGSDDD